jgi:hypothetical protein
LQPGNATRRALKKEPSNNLRVRWHSSSEGAAQMRKYLIVSTAVIIASTIIASSTEARTRCVCQKRIHTQSYDDYAPRYSNRHIYHHYYYSNQAGDRDSERHVYHHFNVSRDRDSNYINLSRNRDQNLNQNVNVNRNRENAGRSVSSAHRNESASSRGKKPEGSGDHQKPPGDVKPGTSTGKGGMD